jgi:hypothetical protein
VIIKMSFWSVARSRQNNQLPTPNDGNVQKTGQRMLLIGYRNIALGVPRISYDAGDATIFSDPCYHPLDQTG